jgi:hypothetical protein|uniref:Uncharacterized protein n=1 Tax=Desulfobacca acetoxidans TaxID=60893 RepID=A0A7C3WSQ3_9BACT
MKTGLIVYVVSGTDLPAHLDPADVARSLGQSADQVELVSQDQGFFTVDDAWYFLVTQGCGRVQLLVAGAENGGKWKPLSPAVRLYG